MIAYWEAVGRLATYPDLFDKLETIVTGTAPAHERTVPLGNSAKQAAALDIPAPIYGQIQDLVEPHLQEQLLPLFSAGELYNTFRSESSREALRQINQILTAAAPALYGPSSSYFIALGLIVVDKYLRSTLKENPSSETFSRLSLQERGRIDALRTSEDFNQAADDLAKVPWELGCNVALRHYPGYLQPSGVMDKSDQKSYSATAPS